MTIKQSGVSSRAAYAKLPILAVLAFAGTMIAAEAWTAPPPGKGKCKSTNPNVVNCRGTCVDISTDASNCGACGNACAGTCCGGTCVDILTDESNCGGCGNACAGTCENGTCATDQTCDGSCTGACGTPSNICDCVTHIDGGCFCKYGNGIGSCGTNADCPPGYLCGICCGGVTFCFLACPG
jgi:hypothetical protein